MTDPGTVDGFRPVDRIDACIARLGLPIRDRTLVGRALTHASWLHEHPEAGGHNERLEFLGDAVISLAVSVALYRRHPDDDEGLLSSRRAAIVSTTGLARIADRLGLGAELFLGEGEAQRGGRVRPSLLASGFEALAGAVMLDLGFERASAWIAEVAAPELSATLGLTALKSPKSRLQELTQRTIGSRPEYQVVEAAGPDHERTFRVEAVVEGRVLGSGSGPSRRIAETMAAAEALVALAGPGDSGSAAERAGRTRT